MKRQIEEGKGTENTRSVEKKKDGQGRRAGTKRKAERTKNKEGSTERREVNHKEGNTEDKAWTTVWELKMLSMVSSSPPPCQKKTNSATDFCRPSAKNQKNLLEFMKHV